MYGSAARNTKRSFIVGVAIVGSTLATLYGAPYTHAQATTTVGATICQASSHITLTSPVSDSVVTQPAVSLNGVVDQASQIDVYIDGNFDSVIPLNIGQTMYSGSTQLTLGTHTIKVEAINICPGSSETASSVVTFEQPPEVSPSTGGSTTTQVGSSQVGSNGVSISSGSELSSISTNESFSQEVIAPFQGLLSWLNINVGGSAEGRSLSLWWAAIITVGLYLMIIGMAVTALELIADMPVVAALLSGRTKHGRVRWLSWLFRVLGLLLILAALLLWQ